MVPNRGRACKRIGENPVKEYNLKAAMVEGMGNGFNFAMGKGGIDWKKVREQLDIIVMSQFKNISRGR